MMLDFTLEKYRKLSQSFIQNDYKILTFKSYLKNKDRFESSVILRHDIDRKPLNALRFAKLENDLGIKSTYYFRYPDTYNIEIIRKIHDMDHEIGYHYEVLSKAKGDNDKAIKLFVEELNKFRIEFDINTICMHGRPLSKYDNRDLWKYFNFKDFGIIGEAYLSCANDLTYLSDTGRNWGNNNKIRDFIPGYSSVLAANCTDDLIRIINKKYIKKFYILTHPERWASSNVEWIKSYFQDNIFNIGKFFLPIFIKNKKT